MGPISGKRLHIFIRRGRNKGFKDVERPACPKTVLNPRRLELLHSNCFNWTFVNTYGTINARLGVNNSLLVLHLDSLARTGLYAGLTAGTFLNIHFCWHYIIPLKKLNHLYAKGVQNWKSSNIQNRVDVDKHNCPKFPA